MFALVDFIAWLLSIYSWIIILGREGLLNSLLLRAGLTSHPLAMLNTPYSVILGLTKNPKTPLAMSMNLMQRLSDRDVTQLSVDRNIPEPLRVAARKRATASTSRNSSVNMALCVILVRSSVPSPVRSVRHGCQWS